VEVIPQETSTKKAPAKKTPVKKAVAKKAPVEAKTKVEKKTPTKKAPTKKTPVKKVTAKKPTAKSATKTTGDDLTKIEGIGPKIAEVLTKNKIKTFADLSTSKVGDLRTILADNGLSQHDPKTWKKQATLAKNGKWDALKILQDELNGGK
jgi:predicted flap endonuclease-1-like 5' DNA nuclease